MQHFTKKMLVRRNNFSSKDTSEVDSQCLYLFSCMVKPSGDLFLTAAQSLAHLLRADEQRCV